MSARGLSGAFAITGGAALFLGAMLTPFWTLAQTANQNSEEPPAVIGQITVGQQIASDNGEVIGITPVELAYKAATRSQALEFNLSLPIWEGSDDSNSFFELREPQAMLHYRRFTKNASFETRLSYRKADLDQELYFDDISEEIVTLDQGSVADREFQIGYAFGNQAKLGGEFTLGYRDRDYAGTTDPNLYDRKTTDADLWFYLEPTPLIRARVLASVSRTDGENDGTDTRSHRIGAGAAMQIDKLTQLDAELAWADITRKNNRSGTDDRAKGLSLRMNAERARPDGAWTLSFASDPGTAGRRERLMLGRNLKLPRYELTAAAGATRFQGNLDPVFEVSYNQAVNEVSEFKASLRQQAVTNSDGDEFLSTNISASYSRNLSKQSSLNGNIRYRASEVQTGDRDDTQTIAFDVNYSHALKRNMSLVAGVNVVRGKDDDDGAETNDERIYFGINRSFDFLP